jgi:hypothetical protein
MRADLKAVAGRLGHTTIRMAADTYVTLFEGRDRDIADRLDQMARSGQETSRRLRAGG